MFCPFQAVRLAHTHAHARVRNTHSHTHTHTHTRLQDPFQAVKLAQRIACIKRMFSFFDEDESGEIDMDEFEQVLASPPPYKYADTHAHT